MNAPRDTSDDWNVEVSAETADRAEEVLREFATDAELDLALIVDAGGGLVAGVATRPDVQVDTVGALVAGAFGAMRALAGELGESGLVESVHHGARDVIHLRDINGKFILLGLTERALPAGLIRVKSAQVSARLAELLAPIAGPAEQAEETPAPSFEEEENLPRTAAPEQPATRSGSGAEPATPPAASFQGPGSASNSSPAHGDWPRVEAKDLQAERGDAKKGSGRGIDGGMEKAAGGKYVFEIR